MAQDDLEDMPLLECSGLITCVDILSISQKGAPKTAEFELKLVAAVIGLPGRLRYHHLRIHFPSVFNMQRILFCCYIS